MAFKKAKRSASFARIAIDGPSTSGKSMTGLMLAHALANGGKVGAIDTERGSLSKYQGLCRIPDEPPFDFDVDDEMQTFSPQNYVASINTAIKEGYSALLIDSLTHAWTGAGGALEMKDNLTKKNNGNSYTAWRDVTPHHNALVERILTAPMHIICTMRVKTEYVLEADERGKQKPKKVGLAAIQREGMEYEFDLMFNMTPDHDCMVSKTRFPPLDGMMVNRPGRDFGLKILECLSDDDSEPPTLAEKITELAPLLAAVPALGKDADPIQIERVKLKVEQIYGAMRKFCMVRGFRGSDVDSSIKQLRERAIELRGANKDQPPPTPRSDGASQNA